ncbi:hypothetical protein [Campylobacter sp. RM12651]|uniref:hypothetical protein n=1 Tax=Campylobacter sp. RM12651 TaxID=1660079 RepID=UPI001EFB54CA|nr:hypothetical protein [Campylobacter sp. RM12651]ULO03738.1 hypothetical protein AVBRAN_1283 [Campylobacter sp. RM12651]
MNLEKMIEIKKRLNEWSNKNKLDIVWQRQTYLTDMLDKIHKYYLNNGEYEQINSLCEMAILTLCVIEDRDINEELVENYEHSFIFKVNGVLGNLQAIAFYNQKNTNYSCYLNEYRSILISVLNELDSLNMDYIKCLEERIK